MFAYEVTYLVLTYHSEWAALRTTLISAVLQKGVRLEIVVADDGSGDFPKDKVEALFKEYDFEDYQLVLNETNRGTIANYISGLEVARGEFTKSIAPGDFLTREGLMRDWVDALRSSGREWSFADVQYYGTEQGNMIPLPTPPFPVYLSPYLRGDDRRARWNYAALDDSAHGVTMLGRTALKLKYARELAATGNRYCEDYIFRVMMFDGVCAAYFPETVVYYEFGTGISSGKSEVWKKRIADEFFRLGQLLLERQTDDPFQLRMQKVIRRKTSMAAMIFIPGKLRRWFLFQVIRRKPRLDFSRTEAWRQLCR